MGNSETGSDEHDNPSHSIVTSFSSTYAIFKFFIALPFTNKKAPHIRGYWLNIRCYCETSACKVTPQPARGGTRTKTNGGVMADQLCSRKGKMAITLNLQFMEPDGTIHDSPVERGAPVIKIYIHNRHNPSITVPQISEAYAMVDTGADFLYIDEDHCRRFLLPQIASTQLQGATLTTQSSVHEIELSFSVHGRIYRSSITSAPLNVNHRPYQLVIGMSAIVQGSLVIDRNKKLYQLTLPENLQLTGI